MAAATIAMTEARDDRTLYRLLSWLTPAFPVGAFTYSHGLETLVERGTVNDLKTLTEWIADILQCGAGRTDGLLLRRAWSGAEDIGQLNELALALSPTRERRLETAAQGTAFLRAARDAWPWPDDDGPSGEAAYPVAVGCVARGHGLAIRPVVHGFLHALSANLISAGVRLVPLGQTDGQRALVALEDIIVRTTGDVVEADPDDIGGIAFAADIASAHHETMYSRLFRS